MSKLSDTKRASEGVTTEGNIGPPNKISIFNFTFGLGSFVGGPSSSRPPDPTGADQLKTRVLIRKAQLGIHLRRMDKKFWGTSLKG